MTPEDYETDLALLCSALRHLMAESSSEVLTYAVGDVGLQIARGAPGVVRVTFQDGLTCRSAEVDYVSTSFWLDRDPTGSLLRTDLSVKLGAASGAALCELVHQHVRRLVHIATMTAARRGLRRGSGTRPKVSLPPQGLVKRR